MKKGLVIQGTRSRSCQSDQATCAGSLESRSPSDEPERSRRTRLQNVELKLKSLQVLKVDTEEIKSS